MDHDQGARGVCHDPTLRFVVSADGGDPLQAHARQRMFTLGVGHVRRRTIEPGSKTDELGPGY